MRVTLIGKTEFLADAAAEVMEGFRTDADGGQALAEASGRSCYRSFSKPNPKTATNAGYLEHILETQHLSVLEHGTASFYIEEVSRSLTHELIRHRHLSPSQLSQRFVDESSVEFVVPPLIAQASYAQSLFEAATQTAQGQYIALVDQLSKEFPDATRKQVREAARSVLPNATATSLVMTGNYRAWMHMIGLRATEAADVEIRALAVEIARQLQAVAPNVFGDLEFVTLDDDTEAIG